MKPREFWVMMDEEGEYGNPEGVTWAYFKDDKPVEGYWIKVREVVETQLEGKV